MTDTQNKPAGERTQHTQHTPGPWTAKLANEHNPNGQTFWDVEQSNGDSVVQLYWYNGPQPQDESNARLIAAAPEMLEALKIALQYFDRTAPESGRAVVARDAISKAEGKETR